MRRRRYRRTEHDPSGIDVTAFLSLMVILVPFLLITAVFTRITALEVQSSAAGTADTAAEAPELQVVVRQQRIEIHPVGTGEPVLIPWTGESDAIATLAGLAGEFKRDHPTLLEATVLVEPEVDYYRLVQVLDVLRVEVKRSGNRVLRLERFPLLSLGPVTPDAHWMQGAR